MSFGEDTELETINIVIAASYSRTQVEGHYYGLVEGLPKYKKGNGSIWVMYGPYPL